MTESVRIAIIGSGPAGLSAAARAAELGLSHLLLEKTDHLSDTIYKYQKGKHVMATPSQLLLRSDLAFDAGKREMVLGTWAEQADHLGIDVRYNAEVTAIEGDAGNFRLTLADGGTVMAENVVFAIGTQGNPNLLKIDGADLPHVQYQLDDPGAYVDEHITIIGSGDAGIENALGLAADPEQGNKVTILNRGVEFARAKAANVALLTEAAEKGRLTIMSETEPMAIEPGHIVLETRDGRTRLRCDRVIARIGSAPPRRFVETCGIEFASEERDAFPSLSSAFESSKKGIFVIGALAGYPLIKHCMNQGYDVIEFINGNTDLKPADQPLLEERFKGLPGGQSVEEWLDFLRARVKILSDLSPLQMREFMLDSQVRFVRKGEVILNRGDVGTAVFGIAQGSVLVQLSEDDPSLTAPIEEGSIFGEVALVSGRRHGSTVRAAEDTIIVEIPRMAALKLMAAVPAAKRAVTNISTERQLLQLFESGLKSSDLADLLSKSEIRQVKAGEAIIEEGEDNHDVFVIRSGSMVVEKTIGRKPVFLSYLPAGSYVGEMAALENKRRTATVRAAIKSEVIHIDGDAFRALLQAHPQLRDRTRRDASAREEVNDFVEAKKDSFSNIVDMYSAVSSFLVENGIGEATDVLLIDETLCVGCDNCEKACADSHEGLSRLNRAAGRTYAHLHVPTSCRHCEHPHCMADCPPNAIHRGQDGEVYIDETCIGCGNCQRNCPYDVIRMERVPPKKPNLLSWLLFGIGPGPGEPDHGWIDKRVSSEAPKLAVKCDMCAGIRGGPACVRACPTGAAIRVAPEEFLSVSRLATGDA